MSPVLEDREMGLISFDKFYYDTTDHQMKAMDERRKQRALELAEKKRKLEELKKKRAQRKNNSASATAAAK